MSLRPIHNRADLVIFDCDGVLVDSEGPANRVLAEFLTEQDLPLSPEESRARFAGYHLDTVTLELAEDGIALPDDWQEQFYDRCLPVLTAEIAPMPQAEETLRALEFLEIGCCVASQGTPAKMEATLTAAGLWPWVEDRIFSAHAVARGKPFPDLFLHAAQSLRVGFDRCVVVEDTPTGVRAAVTAGMRCLALCPEEQAPEMAALGAEPIHNLMEVPWALV